MNEQVKTNNLENKGLRVLSLCGGIETGILALQRLGIPIAEYHTYEILPEAIAVSSHHFPWIIHHGDVYEADWNDYKGFDLVIGGMCCFTKDNMVLTEHGNKRISDICIGDKVLTHLGNLKTVKNLFKRQVDEVIEISTMQSDKITTTNNHPFYVRECKRGWNKTQKKECRIFGKPQWLRADKLDKRFYVGMVVNQIEELPSYEGVDIPVNQFSTRHVCTLKAYFDNNLFWWFVGRYIGDGWTTIYKTKRENGKNRVRHETYLCCGKHEINDVKKKIDLLGIKYCLVEKKTVFQFVFQNYELANYLLKFGHMAHNKHLTKDILNLPIENLKSFIDGYISADGYFVKEKNIYTASTTSKQLALDMVCCINKAYHVHCSITYCIRPKTSRIEGRIINQKDSWQIRFSKEKRKQDHAFYEDGYLWCPIRSINKVNKTESVYNFEVEDDNSYIVQNVIVHNCQSLSRVRIENKEVNNGLLGKSGIVYELQKALEIIKPKWFMAENVIPSNEEDLKELNRIMGVEGVLINSNKFSAQLRDRYYWTNIQGVTVPKDKGIKLSDVLKDGYVPIEKAKCLCKNDSHGYYNGCGWTPIKRFHRFWYKSFGTMIFPSEEYFNNCLETTKRILNGRKSSAKIYDDYVGNDFDEARYLWKEERARLQTVPEKYVECLSELEAADVLGDGWTVDVIAHIFSFMK